MAIGYVLEGGNLRRFGRLFAEDRRDRGFLLSSPKKKPKRTFRYWEDRWYTGDQGETPHCVGFSWVHWLANHPLKQWLNPHGLYSLAQQNDEWEGEDYDGTSVRAGAKVLQSLGFIKEYRWGFDLDSIIQSVLETGPVVFGTEWFTGMMEPDSRGFIHAEGESIGGHAYLVNGVNVKERFFRIKQSWEADWGRNGRAFLSFEDASKLIADVGEACLAIEVRPEDQRNLTPEGL